MVALSQLVHARRFRVPVLIGLVLVAVAVGHPNGLAAAYELPLLTQELQQLKEDRSRLEQESVVVSNRMAVKEALIEDLIAGRITLMVVAERFAEMNSEGSNAEIIRNHYAGESDLERNAHNVLAYAEPRVNHPSAKELLMRELNHQFRRHFGREPAANR